MEISSAIIVLGLLIFFSHLSNELFNITKIPNVLLLLVVGIIIGPVLKLISPDDMGKIGPLFTNVVLIIILFESGTGLKFRMIKKAIGSAVLLTVVNFIGTLIIATLIINLVTSLDWIGSLFVGAIIGGTSSAVVIPMVRQLKMGEKSETILFLESALSDVLCLVVGLALLQGIEAGAISIGEVFSKMWRSFLFAAFLGIIAGLLWSLVLSPLRSIKNSMFTTLAGVFIVWGIVESLGLNGGIAVLMFGIILGNTDWFNETSFVKKTLKNGLATLNVNEQNFFSELAFIVQTYFFVYVGMSIKFGNAGLFVLGFIIVILTILFRTFSLKILPKKGIEPQERAIMAALTPKGLVPAVLASIPLMNGMKGGEIIQDLGYSVVLFSILICSVLVIILSRDHEYFAKLLKRNKKDLQSNMEKDSWNENELHEKSENVDTKNTDNYVHKDSHSNIMDDITIKPKNENETTNTAENSK